MVVSGPKLLPSAMSGSMVLLLLGSVLISVLPSGAMQAMQTMPVDVWKPCSAGPTLHWPWEIWACPSVALAAAAGELVPPHMGELALVTPALGERASLSKQVQESWSWWHWAQENWLCLLPEEGGPSRGPDRPIQLPCKATSSVLRWPNIYPIDTLLECVKVLPTEPELQDLHESEQQQDNWEYFRWGSIIDGVPKARGL